MTNPYSKSESFKLFRSWVALQRVSIETSNGGSIIWKYYDFGPKDPNVIPLVFIPGASGAAESFFKQFISLPSKGYRLIAVQFLGEYNSHREWSKSFDKFLDKLNLSKIHLFGTSLGGYMAQCYIGYYPSRVHSLILCNSFSDTQYYKDNSPFFFLFPVTPEFMLKRMVLSNFPSKVLETEIANSIDFMVEQLESLSRDEILSRLTLNCLVDPNLNPSSFPAQLKKRVTIIDTLDEVAIPPTLRNEVYKFYPDAKVAEMKNGGNFPYLSRHEEFNLLLEVHLRNHSQLETETEEIESENANANK